MIIGLSGYSGTGKDTVGAIIQFLNCYNVGDVTIDDLVTDYKSHEWWLQDQSGWEIKKWAGKLKQIASILTGIPVEKFEDQEFKHRALGREWCYPTEWQGKEHWVEMTVREFLQKLGTDGLRDGLHENTWVNALMADYTPVTHSDRDPGGFVYPNWIITDTRFPNEAAAIKKAGGIIIRIDRPGVSAVNAHPSETALDNWNFDYKIMNGSDLVALMFTVHSILKKQNLSRHAKENILG